MEIFSNSGTKDAIITNYVKAKIDKSQQNSKFRLWDNVNETINHIISEVGVLVV